MACYIINLVFSLFFFFLLRNRFCQSGLSTAFYSFEVGVRLKSCFLYFYYFFQKSASLLILNIMGISDFSPPYSQQKVIIKYFQRVAHRIIAICTLKNQFSCIPNICQIDLFCISFCLFDLVVLVSHETFPKISLLMWL